MSTGAIADFFDAIAPRYERVYALDAEQTRHRLGAVIRELPPPPAQILDLGVGTGRELTMLLDAGYAPTGVDVSRAMLERCARRARPVPLVHADFWQELPFGDSSFDAVIALHGTLAHPPDDTAIGRLAATLAQIIRKHGAWVVEVPSPAWLEHVQAEPGPENQIARRTGPQSFVYEDRVVGSSVAGRVLSDEEWRLALGSQWNTRVESMGHDEWFIVAHRV